MSDVFIFDALRTPRAKGKEGGTLGTVAPAELVRQLVRALADRHGEAVTDIEHLSLGCVGQVGAQGGHIALVSKLHSGLPESASAWSLNNYCTSGLTALAGVVDRISAGSADFAMAGGVESMSQVPFMGDRASYYADPAFSLSLRYLPVALSADVLAAREGIDRDMLDDITLESHARAARAEQSAEAHKSRISIVDEAGKVLLAHDEYVRDGLGRQDLARFEPAFGGLGKAYAPVLKSALGLDHLPPVHTVVHCPGVADGAGLAVAGTAEAGQRRGLTPRAQVLAHAEAGGDPVIALTAGRTAMQRALERAGLRLEEIDVIEYMESFAVVPALFYRDCAVDPARVNIFGGHVARGHPLGASGAILLSTLLDAMDAREARTGLLVTTAASGIGSAMVLQRVTA
jgi:acetyl-CoA C-acetyltransferase